jgi:cytochrome c556
MKRFSFALCSSIGLLVVAALSSHAADSAQTLNDSMKDVVAPKTQIVWDIGNKAIDNQGNPDGSKLSDDDWKQIVAAAEEVSKRAEALAAADHLKVAQPGVKIQSEGNAGAWGAAEVQRAIDANPKSFQTQAKSLATVADATIKAAKARDAKALSDASNQIDGVCEDCHKQFWYPNLK